ncbi:MAG: hypothetical protein WBO10_06765 [Pyrinomonadaceae bacterium]
MRTTIEIEDDILQAAKERAASEGSTAGKVISKWARQGFGGSNKSRAPAKLRSRNGIRQLPSRGEVITMEHVQKIMDDEGI